MIYLLAGVETFCADTANIWQIVGYGLLILKIVIPIILIIIGAIKLGSAVVAAKSEEITKAATELGKKLVGAIIIFFIPQIIGLVFGLVAGFDSENYKSCGLCITNPNGKTCKANSEAAWKSE